MTAGPTQPSPPNPKLVASAATMLAHPLRVRVIASWPDGQRISARAVAIGLDCALSEAVYHLRVLCDGGALELVEQSEAGEMLLRRTQAGRRLAIASDVLAKAVELAAPADPVEQALESELTEHAPRNVDVAVHAVKPELPAAPEPELAEEESLPPARAPMGSAAPSRPSTRPLSKRVAALLQLVRQRPGITVREAGQAFELVNATGLYGPVRALSDDGLIRKEGARLFPVLHTLELRPGSWAERVLEQATKRPGVTTAELNETFGLPPKSTTLYPAIRRLTEHGVLVKHGIALHPVRTNAAGEKLAVV